MWAFLGETFASLLITSNMITILEFFGKTEPLSREIYTATLILQHLMMGQSLLIVIIPTLRDPTVTKFRIGVSAPFQEMIVRLRHGNFSVSDSQPKAIHGDHPSMNLVVRKPQFLITMPNIKHAGLGDDTSLESQRNFSQAQHQLSDSLSLGDKNLEAEFRTMSPEMQNYVIYMLGLVKENATSGSMVETLNDAEPIPRGLTASPSELKSPINVDSESGAHESYQTDDTVESNRIKPSLHISSHIAGHVETQSLPEPKPSTMNRANQRESQERLRVNQSRKVPTVTGMLVIFRTHFRSVVH